MNEKFKRQINFVREIDKLKSILRRTRLFNNSRQENDAEHSWHLAIMAIVFSRYSNQTIDINKVIKMLLIHDITEIKTGDTFLYTKRRDKMVVNEKGAAKKIFSLLPKEQARYFYELWREFRDRKTSEAKYASALDRLEPIMQNYYTGGYSWKKYRITYKEVINVNKPIIQDGSLSLWNYAESIIKKSLNSGFLDKQRKISSHFRAKVRQ